MFPLIQVMENREKVVVSWDLSDLPKASFALQWSPDGVHSFSDISTSIPNFSTVYGRRSTGFSFTRESLGLTVSDMFYLRLGITQVGGVTQYTNEVRAIPSLVDRKTPAGASNSPIERSENVSRFVGANETRSLFTQDTKLIEIFNNTREGVLYVDITGMPASVAKGMPVYPLTYYTVFRHVHKDTGISMISDGPVLDVRMVVHF